MSYAHTQRGGLHWLLWFTAAVCFVGARYAAVDGEALAVTVLVCVGSVTSLIALCFVSLTVRDGEDALEVRFGPVALFRRRIPYRLIRDPRPARSRLIDGFGVHWVPGRGWTWNLWGFDCVEMSVDGKPLRIGTDEPEALAKFLQARTLGGRGA